MLNSVYRKAIWDYRHTIWWWVGGLVALALMMVAFYPALEDFGEFEELMEAYPDYFLAMFGIEEAGEFLTAEGFLHGELYSAMLPIIFLIFAIMRGAAATAGEEQSGTMDLVLSVPVSRSRVVVDKFVAMVALTAGLALSLIVVELVGNVLVDMGLSIAGIVSVNLGLTLLALLFGALSMAVGSWTGRRTMAAGVAAGVAVAAFFVNGLAPLVSALETPQKFSPFYWYLDPKPLSNGFAWGQLGLLAVVSLALFAVAVWAFQRRDIAT
jgi:ABC-2 type transport system permease protein